MMKAAKGRSLAPLFNSMSLLPNVYYDILSVVKIS
jgi:hypothetical protein